MTTDVETRGPMLLRVRHAFATAAGIADAWDRYVPPSGPVTTVPPGLWADPESARDDDVPALDPDDYADAMRAAAGLDA